MQPLGLPWVVLQRAATDQNFWSSFLYFVLFLIGVCSLFTMLSSSPGWMKFWNIHRVSSEMCGFTVCSPLWQGFVGPWQMESSWKHVLCTGTVSSHTVLEQCVKKTRFQSAFFSATQSGGFLPLDLKDCMLLCWSTISLSSVQRHSWLSERKQQVFKQSILLPTQC